jgi:RNA polymerase sigma-70 factor, ECF subfamily
MSSSLSINRFFSDPTAPQPFAELMQVAYGELRHMAAHFFRNERRQGHTLQPTALVHEVFARLAESGPARYENRAQFFGIAARQMRQILVEHVRRVRTDKRGGRLQRVTLEDVELACANRTDFVALDDLLTRFSAFDPHLSRIVELRVFAGLSWKEIAAVVEKGESTVRRDWGIAKAWLEAELKGTL